jgi:AAA domain-containing protein
VDIPQIRGINIESSKRIVSPNTKLAMLLWAASGKGKTHLAGSLDRLTQKFDGKRTLFIPVEASEGGGAVTIRKMDVPTYRPKDLSDLDKVIGTLMNDKTFGGIVIDSATELVDQYIKPMALKYPPKENFATRAAGVPTRSDYQVIGELCSQLFNRLLLMTSHEKPEYRKHLIVTATDKTITDDNDKVEWMGPNLPGRMAKDAVAKFQICGTIDVKGKVVEGKRILGRYLCTTTDGPKALKDRYELLPQEILLKKNQGDDGMDLSDIWGTYFIPEMLEKEQ